MSAAQAKSATNAVAANEYATGSLSAADYNYDTGFSSNAGTMGSGEAVATVTIQTASIAGFDDKGIRGFRLQGVDDQYPQFTKLSGGNIVFVAKDTDFGSVKVKYHKQPDDVSRGDFEATKAEMGANPEGDIDIPELNVEMKSLPIVAKTRKLKAQWTPEFAQDLNAYHSIDAEAELTSMLSEYISQEIDFEILDMLIQDAKSVGYC